MKIFGRSDPGIERQSNQDNYFFRVEGRHALIAVADGMGGHAAGEVASFIAVDVLSRQTKFGDMTELCERCSPDRDKSVIYSIEQLVSKANYEIFEEGNKDSNKMGMGTTLTVGFLCDNHLFIGHVGDSRLYLISGNKMNKLTRDHSIVEEMLLDGKISEEEAANHPQKNMLTRALGTYVDVEVDTDNLLLDEGDIILFCTDGLTSLVREEEIKEIVIQKQEEPLEAVDYLIDLANSRGGHDNITLVIATEVGGHSHK